jgi:hypothetical protein
MSAYTYPVRGTLGDLSTPRAQSSLAPYWGKRVLLVVVAVWASSLVFGFTNALILLTLMGFALAIVGIRQPALGLLGIGILCTVDAPARALLFTGGLLRFNTFNYWLLIVMVASIPFLLRLKDPHTRLLQAFVLLLGLQLAVAPSLLGGIQVILPAVTAFGLLVYFAAAYHDKEAWYWLGVVAGTVSALGGLVFLLQRDSLPYVNPNAWAFFPLTGLFAICMGLPFAKEAAPGRLALQFLGVMNLAMVNLVWVLLSSSRGVLSIAAVCLVYLVLAVRGLSRRLGMLAIAAVLALVVSIEFGDYYDRVAVRVGRLIDPNVELTTRTSGRYDLMVGGWYIFLNHPFGVGPGGFRSAWADLGDLGGRIAFQRKVGEETPAHSGWVQVLAENGFVGVLLFAAYVASFAVVGASKSRQSWSLLLLGMLVTTVMAVGFISTEFRGKGLWFLAAGVTVLLHGLDLRVRGRSVPFGETPSSTTRRRLMRS